MGRTAAALAHALPSLVIASMCGLHLRVRACVRVCETDSERKADRFTEIYILLLCGLHCIYFSTTTSILTITKTKTAL